MTSAQKILQQPWMTWFGQIRAVLRIDLRKSFFTKRGLLVYLLAFAPVVIILLHATFDRGARWATPAHLTEDTEALAFIVQLYYIRFAVFFGCMGIFTWLLRGEVVEKTLHYYFLTPMRREVLAIGKFLAGVIAAATIFGGGVLLSSFLMFWHIGPVGRAFLAEGAGQSQLAGYVLMTVMACAGYGAVFFALSLVFRNPIVPAALLMGWESISGILPAFLQKVTITYYLKQLAPVTLHEQGLIALFTVVPQPLPKAVAVLSLCILCAAIVTAACFGIRRMEISYSVD
jgi:ABC-type transport system involved in multi-copper enzyme maturation permease subunit